jgi:hypothetical protein
MEKRQHSTASCKIGNEIRYVVMCSVYCEQYLGPRGRASCFRERLGTVRVILYSSLQDLDFLNMRYVGNNKVFFF